MQIHDLNTKALTDPAYVAFDDGTDTYKVEFNDTVESAAQDAVAEADLTQNTVDFTSGDSLSPSGWTSVSQITANSTLATLFNRISTMVKNVRYIWNKIGTASMGTTATTITGAIAEHESDISTLNSKTTSYLLSASVSSQSFTAGEIRAIQFTLTVPTGFRVISISDVSNFAYLIGVPITWGLGDGQVTVYMNYFANTALTNKKLSIRAYAVKV